MMTDLMDKILSLTKRRGFIFPGSEIYGGLQSSWDYGPLGVELKNNIKNGWWKRFVHRRTDMVGIDAALIMNPKVWEASGHLKNFSDPLVECKKCHSRFRADNLGSTDSNKKNNGQPMASYQDVNGDGFTDVIVHVITNALQLISSDIKAELDGFLLDGREIKGPDSVRIVPQ